MKLMSGQLGHALQVCWSRIRGKFPRKLNCMKCRQVPKEKVQTYL